MKYLLIALLACAGCSRTLPFAFQFGDEPDLAGSNQSPDLSVGGTNDLTVVVGNDDLTGAPQDLAAPISDLPVARDLPIPDLRSPDLRPVGHPIGGTCSEMSDCATGLTCILTIGGLTFPSGYCTKACQPPAPNGGTNPCGDGNACVLGFYNGDMAQYMCAVRCTTIANCRSPYQCCPPIVSSNTATVCMPAAAEYCQ